MLLCRHDWNQAFGTLISATLLRSMRGAHRCSQSRQGVGGAWIIQGAGGVPSKPTRAEAREGFDSQEKGREQDRFGRTSAQEAWKRELVARHRLNGRRLGAACVVGAESFGGELARARSEASVCGRSTRRFRESNPVTYSTKMKTEPNKVVEPTPVAVTSCACAHLAPSTYVAHLRR